MKKDKFVAYGELMLRLTPPQYNRIEQSDIFYINYGGGEANVAIALSCMGDRSEFFSKLPKNQLGDGAIKHMRGYGVSVENIIRDHENMGIYFLEMGFAGRPSRVSYNRRHSAITTIELDEVNFDKILEDGKWFHVSGITLALSKGACLVAIEAAKRAKEKGMIVSFDFNYRSKLWTKQECKESTMLILPYVDVLFTSPFDATQILNIEVDENLTGRDYDEAALYALLNKYNIKYIFGTHREVFSATDNSLSAYICNSQRFYYTTTYRFNIFDRVGGGDAFAAGVIHALLNDYQNYEYAVQYGLACSVLKHTIQGDAFILKEREVIDFLNNSNLEIKR